MTVQEKIGQMCQLNLVSGPVEEAVLEKIRRGEVGSFLNETDVDKLNALQKVAVEESRLGIPLLMGRDVIHGFQTVFPIPLAQACSWNPERIREGASIAASEAARSGINWTFAPMIDISRDPRWGRIAESLGEDPYLCGVLGAAMTEGFQGQDLGQAGCIAATAKHFAAYGAAESGRDYAATTVPENELRNVYLPPFKAAAEAGVASFMTSFSDIDGIPASGNDFLLRQILREEWQYPGFVVSDWCSVEQLCVHGIAEDRRQAALQAARAGVDMEMVSTTFEEHLHNLIETGELNESEIDRAVLAILTLKLRLGLFEQPYTDPSLLPEPGNSDYLNAAKQAAIESTVLLKNTADTLPLNKERVKHIALIGPLADDAYEQLGTWVFDGEIGFSVDLLSALQKTHGDDINIDHVKALETSRCRNTSGFENALAAAQRADTIVAVLGEEAILSGEAHCRADIDLPGAQPQLFDALANLAEIENKPLILIVMAGRPLTIEPQYRRADAVLYAWHPGTMGGPAITELLFGDAVPSAKLPVSFPKVVGQIPVYYSQKNSGKPPTPETVIHIDAIEVRAQQTSVGNTSFHLDAGHEPLFPFGFGLSYSSFEYSDLHLSRTEMHAEDCIDISVTLHNRGDLTATEISQLYIRDKVGSLTRPVRELKGFLRNEMKAGERRTIVFSLNAKDLAFYGRDRLLRAEAGEFEVWVGGDSTTKLGSKFLLLESVRVVNNNFNNKNNNTSES